MKTAKLVIGIISIVFTAIIMFQSCAVSIGEVIMDEGGTSGFVGVLVAIFMLGAGIVAIAARNSKGGGIACTIIYALAGIIGVTAQGDFSDLKIWGVLCFIFALFFLIATITFKKEASAPSAEA
jgi:hypothetical protein